MDAPRLARLGRTVGGYVVFGPLFGAVITIVILVVVGAIERFIERRDVWLHLFPTLGFWTEILDLFSTLFVSILLTMNFSVVGYLLGLLPALLAGLIVGLCQIVLGRITWRVAAVVGALVGVPYSFVLGWPFMLIPLSVGSIIFSIMVCVTASALCWLFIRPRGAARARALAA